MRTRFGVAILVGVCAQAIGADAPLAPSTLAEADLGRSVFQTQWAPAGKAGAAGRVGVGPLYNAASCNTCHNDGDRGTGPAGSGPAPNSLVIQLESPATNASSESTGDPAYGRVFNTAAVDGARAEGTVTIRYSEVAGYYYPFGGQWSLRIPHYSLAAMTRGPMSPHTVIKPRIAPALFGISMLAAIPESAITQGANDSTAGATPSGTLSWVDRHGTKMLGRLGWQCEATTIRDQVSSAFAREMGLTSDDRHSDDCTIVEPDCRNQGNADAPEVSDELLDAVVAYLGTLDAPGSRARDDSRGAGFTLFQESGCTDCHRPTLPVEGAATISPYTDLRLHDLGMEMADEDASGTKIPSKWRTAPLWGLGQRMEKDSQSTFLHDGRARTAEEAILWHGGEAAYANRKFTSLGPRARETLLRWLTTL